MQTTIRPLFHAVLPHLVETIEDEELGRWPMHLGALDLGVGPRMVYLAGSIHHDGSVYVHHEIAGHDQTLRELIVRIGDLPTPPPWFVATGPDATQRNVIDHDSPAQCLHRHGLDTLVTRESVRNGLALLTRLFIPTAIRFGLKVHPRCYHLLWALRHYAVQGTSEAALAPVCKEASHAADTLRYLGVGVHALHAQHFVVDPAVATR